MTTPAEALKPLLLAPPARTLAVAESVTCGHLQARLGAVSGASGYFLGGVTVYTLEQKVRWLGVDRASAAAVNCVSAHVAEAMARGACERFPADVALATTGYAEPAAEWGVVQPFAWWAVALRRTPGVSPVLFHGRIECAGASRIAAQAMIAERALGELLAILRQPR